MKFITHINLNGLELQNPVLHNLASAPSTPKAGWFYFDTAQGTAYMYNGASWIDMLSQGDYIFQNGIELVTNTRNVQLKLATGANAGNVAFTANSNGLSGNVAVATTDAAGVIEIATDSEVETGTDTSRAVTPAQLATKVTKNAAITAGTGTVVTYDSKGLVTGSGEIGIKSGSTNYLEFDTTNHEIGAKVDTTVTDSSTNLVTSGAVASAIASAIAGGVHYAGTWAITTTTTDFSGITLPVKKGYLYYVTGTGPATVDGIEWNPGDYLLVNDDVAAGGSLSGKVEKIDNTEAADIVRLNATQTLTNKTIDADDNTITDLTTANLKSGVLVTSVRGSSSASDTSIASEKAVATLVEGKKATFTNPALTASGGICSWTITTSLAPDCNCIVRETSGGEEVMCDKTYGSGTITVSMIAASVAADTYTAVVLG